MANAFEMRRPRHAIGEFTATLKFYQGVGADTFSRVKLAAEKQAERLKLPVPIKQQTVQFSLGVAPQITQQAQEGIGYQSFARDGEIETAILCEPDSIVLTLHDYEKWQTVHPMIVETFSPIAEEYLSEVPAVRSISLQYLNEFRSREENEVSTGELFKSDTKWLASFGLMGKQPWHCHSGLFIPVTDRSRFLVHVNCDVATAQFAPHGTTHTLAKAFILVALNFDIPGEPPLTVAIDDARQAISEYMNQAHTLEKQLLAEVIADEYLEMMGALNG